MHQVSSHQAEPDSQQQLALEVFASLDLTDTPITESAADFRLRKSHLLVDVSDVGLLARRALNGCYFFAQGDPDAEVHTVDLRYFKWLINYANSNNNTHLKKVLREAQKSAIQVNVIDPANPDEDSWVSVPMLGPTGIKRNRLTFEIPRQLRAQLRDPQRYSLLSMRILAGFTSAYALELYERLAMFKDGGATPWWSLDEFRQLIRVDGLKIANDFRYFKRDIIMPAVEQINAISDIDVAFEQRRTGRFVSHLRFVVNASSRHLLVAQVTASKELYDVLTQEFGLSDVELDEISSNRNRWGDERLATAIEFVRHRMKTGKVLYPGKYLMTAIRDGCRIGSHEVEFHEKKNRAEKSAAARTAENQQALAFARQSPLPEIALPEGEELERAWQAFLASPNARLLKQPAARFADADERAQKAFKGFLSSRDR